MKPSRHQLSALIAFAGLTFAASSANATLSYLVDDVSLGFRDPNNNLIDYLIDIGQPAQFRDATSPVTVTLTGLVTDLNAAFGPSWASNLKWGFVGGTQNTAGTAPDNLTRLLYSSEPVGTSPTASSSQSGPASSVVNMKNYWLTLTGTGSAVAGNQGTVSNSAYGDPGQTNSWSTRVQASFGSPAILSTMEDSVSNPLDFFRVPQTTNGTTTNEGSFSLNTGTGAITFIPTPEPSSAVLAGVGLLLWIGRCRHRRAFAAPMR